MPITLPLTFDTAQVNTRILTGVVGLEAIVVAGVAYSLGISDNVGVALGLTLMACVFAFFATASSK